MRRCRHQAALRRLRDPSGGSIGEFTGEITRQRLKKLSAVVHIGAARQTASRRAEFVPCAIVSTGSMGRRNGELLTVSFR
jgi:hypothetical protein